MSSFGPGGDANPFDNNPYRPTVTNYAPIVNVPPVGTAQLASLSQRFLGFLLDSFLPLVFVLPGYGMVIAGLIIAESQQRQGNDPSFPVISVLGGAVLGLGFIITLIIQIYLLATRSQTLGKYIMKTQVVDFDTGKPADFLHCGILRILVNTILTSIPCVGFIYFLVDSLYILRDDRRCIHDLIASTTVIDITNQ